MRNIFVLKPVDIDVNNVKYSNKHSYMYQPFVDTIFDGFEKTFDGNVEKIHIETGYNTVQTKGVWNHNDSKNTINKINERLISGDILIVMTSFMFKFNFNDLKNRGIYVIVYETEAINQPWGRGIIYDRMIHKNSYPNEIWTYNEYNKWALEIRKINKKIKTRVVYPGFLKSPKIKQKKSSKFFVMDSFYTHKIKKRSSARKFLEEKKFFKENAYPIEWWDTDSFISKYTDVASGIAVNIMKCSNINFSRTKQFVRPLNTASLIRYLSMGVLVVSDLFQNKQNVFRNEYDYFSDLIDFIHLYDIPNKLNNLTALNEKARQYIEEQRYTIYRERFDPVKIIKSTNII